MKVSCVENISRVNQDFIKKKMKIVKLRIFSKLNLSILNNWIGCIIIYHLAKKGRKFRKFKKLVRNLNYKQKDVVHVKTLKLALNQVLILEKRKQLIIQ